MDVSQPQNHHLIKSNSGRTDRVADIDLTVALTDDGDCDHTETGMGGYSFVQMSSQASVEEASGSRGIPLNQKLLLKESESNASETRDVDMLKPPYQTEIFKVTAGGRGGEDEDFHIGEINGRRSDSSNKVLELQLRPLQSVLASLREENNRLKHELSHVMKENLNLQMLIVSNCQPGPSGSGLSSKEVSRAISAPPDIPQGGDFLAKLSLSSRLSQKDGKCNVALVPKPGTTQNGDELLANLVPRSSERLGKDLSPSQAETEPASRPEETPPPSRAGCEPNLEEIIRSFPTEKRDAASLGHGVANTTNFVANKVQKLSRQSSNTDVSLKLDSMNPPISKDHVSARAHSGTETVSDGGRWRKYGQKLAKGSLFPRAYYRCTEVPGCGVRKQVQRSADDNSVWITTYDGRHNHPIPQAGEAMASTTCAAVASTPRSGSTTSAMAPMARTPSFPAAQQRRGSSSRGPSIAAPTPSPSITLDLTKEPETQLTLRLGGTSSL